MIAHRTKDSVRQRSTVVGRWAPVFFSLLITTSWFLGGVMAGVGDRLWLAVLSLPPLGIYLVRATRR